MIKLDITEKIKKEYIKTLKNIFLTPKTKKFTENSKRFYNMCKQIGATSYNDILYNFLLNSDLKALIRRFGKQSFDEINYKIYDNFRKEWAYKIVELLSISVCPYCNRNYIVNFDKNSTTVELDHFYSKSEYPYLAISLYNLIPVCHTCNHKKLDKEIDIHPYFESYNDYVKNSFVLKSVDFHEKNIELKYIYKKNSTKDIQKIESYNKTLNIKNLYENHKDIVKELLQKRVIYSDSYIDELFDKYSGILFSSKEELMRLITCGYISDDDINKRPLSKLIKDISEDLGFR